MPVASTDALTGLGFAPQQAELLGGQPNLQAGVGTTQPTASILKSKNTELNPQAGATAFVFPPNAGVMEPWHLVNNSAGGPALVFVPSGHTLIQTSGATLNGSLSMAQFKSAILWQYKPKFWAALVTA